MRVRAKLGVVGATAAMLFGAMAGVAHADSGVAGCGAEPSDAGGVSCTFWFYKPDGNTEAGIAGFVAYGEHISAQDRDVDGRGVFISASWSGGYKELWVTGGDTSRKEANLSIAEGVSVTVKACQTNNGSLINCATRTAKA
ncbi:hypothetical protein H9Y04_24220 [Streptomyces sp. TRM66268-LWL]|uniref:Uncharacterized protein n=1 Tax=Streptomyces polyasparticus TaxID=2767826 RepID=A0ABR7SJI2_9ACTN|nr:hypothetical protein [Streptomyces polyasparticus]MBC9715655.1 hypothetical protein [Streptomyces polyasparticus]